MASSATTETTLRLDSRARPSTADLVDRAGKVSGVTADAEPAQAGEVCGAGRGADDHARGGGTSPDARRGLIDLFAGIGCVARGFAQTGWFDPLGLIDVDKAARDTYLHNFPGSPYRLADVDELTEDVIEEMRDGRTVAGVVGCPPCQGFSAAGGRKHDDVRNRLLGAFFAAVTLIDPLFFVMENVPAIIYRPELQRELEQLSDRFATTAGVLNGACYGLPQTRQRAIVIGYRRDLEIRPALPAPTHFGSHKVFCYSRATLVRPSSENIDEILGESPHIGVRRTLRRGVAELLPEQSDTLADLVDLAEAIGDLPVLSPDSDRQPTARSGYARALAGDIGEAPNHAAWAHTAATISKLAGVPEGGRLKTAKRYYSQAYTRLHRSGLARTITTNFHNAGCGRFTHWAEPRTLTVREAARLQGIPDSFEFIGHRSTQERLVGNAFPPPWAKAIAEHVATQLDPAVSFRRTTR